MLPLTRWITLVLFQGQILRIENLFTLPSHPSLRVTERSPEFHPSTWESAQKWTVHL